MIKLPDVTVLYVIFCFGIAYAILKRFLFAPLGAILDARDREEREADALQNEAHARLQKALTEAEQTLSEARREALKVRENLRAEGQSRLDARLSEAGAAAAAAVASASERLKAEADALQAQLREQSQGFARTLAEKVLGRKLAA